MVIIFPAVPAVTIFVVKIVIGLFPPTGSWERGVLMDQWCSFKGIMLISHAQVRPAPPCSADMGMVLMMVVPGFEDPGVMPRMVDLVVAA